MKQEDKDDKKGITDIVALSSHKTHSTPVDPVELKKRLVDLLVQRQARGEQQALKLKVKFRFLAFKPIILSFRK